MKRIVAALVAASLLMSVAAPSVLAELDYLLGARIGQ
jgi:hypothetical protein